MIAPLALAIRAADLEVSATFARRPLWSACRERQKVPLHHREAWRMPGRERPRALTGHRYVRLQRRGTLSPAPRPQSTISSQCK